jgi:2-oxoisovalerate dehydrogenase E1 component
MATQVETQNKNDAQSEEIIPLRYSLAGPAVTNDTIIEWYKLAFATRQLDDKASTYIRRGMGWSYHARCSGHEGIQIALGLSFRANTDFLFPYYRDAGTCLAAGISPYELFLNGLSRDDDPCSGGRHMSNHFGKPAINVQNVSSCTGNHTLHAVGVARATKFFESDSVAFSSQGDSSASEGYVFEALSGACRERLPVCFVIQNNGYGISVPVWEQSANPIVADNFAGLKYLHVVRCDGTDIFSSWAAMQEALEYIRSGKGPALVHAQCVRMGAHSNSDAHGLYRTEEEISDAAQYDPVKRLRHHLLSHQILDESEVAKIEEHILADMEKDAVRAEEAALPTAESVELFVVPPAYETQAMEPPVGEAKEKLREAINRTLKEEFRLNPKTFLWGQDVASKDKGGVFNLTKGMQQEFGKGRVFNAPIAEDFIVGTANGMCRYDNDIRVVIEAAQFADYVWPAMEQIVETSHDYWRSKGQFSPNMTIRLASGGYITGGIYHSQNVEAIMSHLPGVRVVYPAFADDAAGLLRTSIRSEGMTFFLEPKNLYNRVEARAPQTSDEYAVPFGKGRFHRRGEDLTLISYGNTIHFCNKVADILKAEGHDLTVFDLRSIKPLDTEGIVEATRMSGKVLVVHEDHVFNGIAGEVIAQINEHCFMDLDAPVLRHGAKDIPVGFSKILETAILPQIETIEKEARSLLAF